MQPSIRAAAIQIGAHNTNPRTFELFGRSVHKLRSPGLHGIRCGSSLLISEVKKCTAQPITLRSLSLSTGLGFRPDLRWSTDFCASQDGRSRRVKSCLASLNRRLNPVTPAPARPRNGGPTYAAGLPALLAAEIVEDAGQRLERERMAKVERSWMEDAPGSSCTHDFKRLRFAIRCELERAIDSTVLRARHFVAEHRCVC